MNKGKAKKTTDSDLIQKRHAKELKDAREKKPIPAFFLDNIESKLINNLLPILKLVSNIIIILLIIALTATILYKLYILFFIDIVTGDFHNIINDLLLTLILIELYTILYSYLQKYYIKVERVIELGVISIIREMLFKVQEFEITRIYAIAVLLLSFGVLFFIEKYYSKSRNV